MKDLILRAAPAALGLVFVSIGACRSPSQRTQSQAPQSSVEVGSTLDASFALSAPDAHTESSASFDDAVAPATSSPVVSDDAGAKETEGHSSQRGPGAGGRDGSSSVEPRRRTSIGHPCKTDDDCAPDGLCGFPGAAHCAARGTCLRSLLRPGMVCAGGAWPGCACDGTYLWPTCGLPAGFYSKPLRHSGPCNASEAVPVPPRPPRKLSPCEASCNGDLMCLMKCQPHR